MKIYSNKAQQFITSLPCQSVLVYGNDAGEVSDITQKIIRNFLPSPEEMSVISLSMEKIKENHEVLFNEISSMSFFADKKLIIINESSDHLTKLLEKIIPTLPKDIFLLVSAEELTKTSSLRKFFEDSPILAAILCYKEDAIALRNHVIGRLAEQNVTATNDALEYICGNLGDNKMITNNEIDKILVYLGDKKKLEFEDVLNLLADNNEITLINLAFSITNSDLAGLERNFLNVAEQQESAVAILRVVIWHFQRLLTAKIMMDSGLNAVQAVKSLRPPVFFKQEQGFVNALNGWSKEKLQKALEKLVRAELAVKKDQKNPDIICHGVLLSLAA